MSTPSTLSVHNARSTPLDDLLSRVRGEYEEMPGLSLTLPQAQRLWALDQPTCVLVLSTLVEKQYLKTTSGGRYVRTKHAVW